MTGKDLLNVHSLTPLLGAAPHGQTPTQHLPAEPIQHDHKVGPAQGGDEELGHIDAPELARPRRSGFAARRLTLGPVSALRHQEFVFFHQAIDPFVAHRQSFSIFQPGPNPAIAPKRMALFDHFDVG